MKKFYFFLVAAIAVIASAACTKVDPVPQDIPVSFQVANYVPQTKANEAFDIVQTFTTYAWFQPTSGDAQVFMSGETIRWQSSSNTWAPDRVYYWPKTGYVNFFSYAGTPTPDVTNGTANYSNKTIAITDDALLASAAYKYNSNVNEITGIQYNGTDVTGVPTLFHHVYVLVLIDDDESLDRRVPLDVGDVGIAQPVHLVVGGDALVVGVVGI